MSRISPESRRNLLLLLLGVLVVLAAIASTIGMRHFGGDAELQATAARKAQLDKLLAEFDQTLESCVVAFAPAGGKVALATYLEKPYVERSPSECSVSMYSSPGVKCLVGAGNTIYSRFAFDDRADTREPPAPHVAAFRTVTASCIQQKGLALAPAFDVCEYLDASSGGETASQCFGIRRNIENGRASAVALVARERLIRGHLGKGAMAADPEYAAIVRGLKESDARIEQSIEAHRTALGVTGETTGSGWTVR